MEEYRGEASNGLGEWTETLAAKRTDESPAIDEQLIEEVCARENCKQALKRVKANKGSPGADGMTVQQLPEYLKEQDEGCGLRSGSCGRGGPRVLRNSANGAWVKTWPHKRRVALMVRGGLRTVRHSRLRCPMLTSTRSGFRDGLSVDCLTRRTAGWTRMSGGVGGEEL